MDRAPWEVQQLLLELLVERYGPPRFRRAELKEAPRVIAARRRVLCGLDDMEAR